MASASPMVRRFGLIHATALNMTNMIGIGPFITIPLLMSALGGPQAMLGWLVALIIVMCDGMVWSELGAALPGSGGSFGYLRRGYGTEQVGRLMGFLFVWQFVLSGPLEIASGYIGFSQYLGYIWKGITARQTMLVVTIVGLANLALLYRRITSIAAITVTLWIGTIITAGVVVVTGALHFDHRVAFDFPPGAFTFSLGFLLGLGAASRIGVYDYLGYYDVCYIGDEVRDPGRVIPRSILISTVAVAIIYLGINLSIIGVVPWREFVPATEHPESNFVVSVFMQKIYGPRTATIFTLLVLWTAVGLMLLRRHAPQMPRPYRMWLYPLPALVALLGWIFVFATTELQVILFGVGVLALGCVAFIVWSRNRDWGIGANQRLRSSIND